jgi:biopolymer transport protein TolQ
MEFAARIGGQSITRRLVGKALLLCLTCPVSYGIPAFYSHGSQAQGGAKAIPFYLALLQAAEGEAVTGPGLFALFPRTPLAIAVMGILIAFSLLSWTIIVRKWLTFKHIEQQTREFIDFFRKSARLSEVSTGSDRFRGTPLVGLFTAAYQELNAQLQAAQTKEGARGAGNPSTPSLTERNVAGIQRSLQRAAAAEISSLERNMSWLATTGSVTPFVGLLGTVLGIIGAFEGLGIEKTASIQAVAPGIAEALIATAAGLFAAIPAVIAYNQFLNRIKNIAAEMDDFSAELLNLFERSFG